MWIISFLPMADDYVKLSQVNILQYGLIKAEIIDIRESNGLFYTFDAKNLITDTLIVYDRFVRLKDAPFIWTHFLFTIHPDTLANMISINRGHKNWLSETINLQTNWALRERLELQKADNEFLYDIYDALNDSKRNIYYIHIRRVALLKLKNRLDKIDKEMFWKGELPPNLPLWFFNPI